MKKLLYLLTLTLVFTLGYYTRKVGNTGLPRQNNDPVTQTKEALITTRSIASIGENTITASDSTWEVEAAVDSTNSEQAQTDQRDFKEALQKKLASQLIERKLLYRFISQDPNFDITDPKRFISCISQWQQIINDPNATDHQRLHSNEFKARLCETDVLQQYLKERIYPSIIITEEAISTYYSNNIATFDRPEQVIIRQIVLATETEAAALKAKVTTRNFADLATQHSIADERAAGGLLGPFGKQNMPRIFDVAFNMQPGEIKGVIKSDYGFHIMKLERRIPKTKLSLKDAEATIREILIKKQREEKYQKWVETALNQVPIAGPKL